MAAFTVRRGRRYRATIVLGLIERWAANESIAEKLRAAGFSEVSVRGTSDTRVAEALWPGPNTTGEMPCQLQIAAGSLVLLGVAPRPRPGSATPRTANAAAPA
jgi:hypothetical protein